MELKPCPFCGGEAELSGDDGASWVVCVNCNARGEWYNPEWKAARQWNARHTAPEVKALVEVCEGARARSGWVQRMYERLYVDDLDDNLQEVFWRFILNLQSALAPFQESTDGDKEEQCPSTP